MPLLVPLQPPPPLFVSWPDIGHRKAVSTSCMADYPHPPTIVVDPVLRAQDFTIPNLNSSFVEYEVFLKTLLERGNASSGASAEARSSQARSPPRHPDSSSGASRAPSAGLSAGRLEFRSSPGGPSSLRARQEKDAAAAAWDAGIEQMLNAAAIGNWEGSAVAGDGNDHVTQLLRMYLNGDLLKNMTGLGSQDLFDSMMSLRRDHIFPMIAASKAAYGALIAYMETTPGTPVRSENEYFVPWHLNLAFSLVNSELKDPEKLDSDGVILTIVLLMMISQRNHDMDTFRAHALGLVTLTKRRQRQVARAADSWSDTSASPIPDATTSFFPEHFSEHSAGPLQSPTSSSWTSQEMSPSSMVAPTSTPRRPDRPLDGTGRELQPLVDKGLIPGSAMAEHQYMLILNHIAADARYDWILALALAQHLWTDGGFPVRRPPLERALHIAARLCLHINVWPVSSRPCMVALRAVAAVRASLLEYRGLDALYLSAPDALAWMALTAGPLAIGHARAWFVLVLRRAAPLAGLASFADFLAMASARFAWTPAASLAAHVFWLAALHPSAFDDAALADFTRRPPDVDAAEAAQCWMLGQRLKREAAVPPLRFSDGPWERAAPLQDVRAAEDELVHALLEAVTWEVDGVPGRGRRQPIVWIPPSPPCLLGSKCLAHGSLQSTSAATSNAAGPSSGR